MTVAESLANATPVITTNATPWKDLDIKNAGWCIDVGVKELKEVLEEALVKSSYDLSQMGLNGREWMKINYSWDSIADEMLNTYKWMLNKAEQPKCVKNE
jgi:glycosyltransferase involved in cell wall biosynthesis